MEGLIDLLHLLRAGFLQKNHWARSFFTPQFTSSQIAQYLR